MASYTMFGFAQTKQPITIVWAFGVAQSTANMVRAIIEQANKDQDKYVFVFDNKPGAGGSIASRYVERTPNTILATAAPFFIHPLLYGVESSHDITKFQPILIEATNVPLVVVSKKYKTFEELKKEPRLTIGISTGSPFEVAALELKTKLPNTQLDLIGYPNSMNATKDAIGGVVDLSVDFPSLLKQHVEVGNINVIGMTGTIDHPYFKTFSAQGVKGFENLTSYTLMLVPKGTYSKEQTEELHSILRKAQKNQVSDNLYAADYGKNPDYDLKQTQDYFNKTSQFWESIIKARGLYLSQSQKK